ncbi:hypothetical protein VLK31_32195 [Variovorax sp. H27-G14]
MMGAPLAAVAYPFLLRGFNIGVTSASSAWLALAAVQLLLAIAVPLVGFVVALRLGEQGSPTPNEVLAKWVALLSMASAPLYTFLGVVLYMAGDPVSDFTVWLGLWAIGLALMAKAAFAPQFTPQKPRLAMPSNTAVVSPRMRVAHGISAAAILLLFLGMHLSNHLGGLLSESVHRSLMDIFRTVYRARLIEPIVVGLFLFMVGSGLALVAGYVRQKADVFRTLQVASGVYLVFFVLGHMNSVFFYARMLLQIPTDWNFATGAPTGLIKDAWNIRLLPHYMLGVFFVLSHLVLGARIVAVAHRVEEAKANTWTWAGIVLSAAVAVAIILGMSGLHISN